MRALRAIEAEVRGLVQGVGFRYATVRVARELHLDGWVRNLPDGSVAVRAQGAAAAVDEFVAFLRRGPRGATVETAEVVEMDVDPTLAGFEVRF